MKRVISLILAVLMVASFSTIFASCGASNADFKVGFIFLHDENSTYDLNFINAAKTAQKNLGLSDELLTLLTRAAPLSSQIASVTSLT